MNAMTLATRSSTERNSPRLSNRRARIELSPEAGRRIASSTVRREGHVEVDLDLVAELEGAKERRVRPDPPSALDDTCPTNDPAIGHTPLHHDRLGHAHDRQLAVAGERRRRLLDPPGPEGDDWVLGGVEYLAEGLLDLCAVGLGERLDTTGSFSDLQGLDLNLDGHQGVRRGGGIDRGATMPAGDLDGAIVAGLGTQPCPGRVDQEPAGLWSEPVGTGNLHGRRLRRRRDARCAAEATVTMGDQEGHRRVPGLRTWLHPTALSASLRRRPGPSAIARRNHAVRRPTSLVWRSLVGITSESTHASKQRPAA